MRRGGRAPAGRADDDELGLTPRAAAAERGDGVEEGREVLLRLEVAHEEDVRPSQAVARPHGRQRGSDGGTKCAAAASGTTTTAPGRSR